METDDRLHKLLEEIRDGQREHLAEYRRVTTQSLELQQRGVARQEQFSLVYRRIAVFGGVLVAWHRACSCLFWCAGGPISFAEAGLVRASVMDIDPWNWRD